MITSNLALLDSNILIYNHQALSKFHSQAEELLDKGLKGFLPLAIRPQVVSEFFAIITSHRRVTNPIASKEAAAEVEKYLKARNILKIYPGKDILDITLSLLKKY